MGPSFHGEYITLRRRFAAERSFAKCSFRHRFGYDKVLGIFDFETVGITIR